MKIAQKPNRILTAFSCRREYAHRMPVVKRLQKIGRASRVIIVGPPMLLELGRKAGVDPALLGSVPVIAVRGRLLLGFDRKELDRLLAR